MEKVGVNSHGNSQGNSRKILVRTVNHSQRTTLPVYNNKIPAAEIFIFH